MSTIEQVLLAFKTGEIDLTTAAIEITTVLRADCQVAHAALLRVQELHAERTYSKAEGGIQTVGFCASCGQAHPCETRRAIRGEPPVEVDYSVR